MPGAHTERRTFDLLLHGHDGAVIIELLQLEARDLAAFEGFMVRTSPSGPIRLLAV
jgi:hypothetical protein